MSRVKTPSAGLAAILAGTYLFLSVLSVACAVEHDRPEPSSHHHGSTVSHSSFCAWSCQANPTSDAEPSALLLHPFLMAMPLVQNSHAVISAECGFHAASRAPPVQS
jgi:hypothetical protein